MTNSDPTTKTAQITRNAFDSLAQASQHRRDAILQTGNERITREYGAVAGRSLPTRQPESDQTKDESPRHRGLFRAAVLATAVAVAGGGAIDSAIHSGNPKSPAAATEAAETGFLNGIQEGQPFTVDKTKFVSTVDGQTITANAAYPVFQSGKTQYEIVPKPGTEKVDYGNEPVTSIEGQTTLRQVPAGALAPQDTVMAHVNEQGTVVTSQDPNVAPTVGR